MSRVDKTPEARRDIVKIGMYIGERNPAAGERFPDAVDDACMKLSDMPLGGAICESDHPKLAGLRTWTIREFPNHVILYRPQADGIEVIRVYHGSQDLEGLFENKR